MPRAIRADGNVRPLVPLLSWLTGRYIAKQRRRVLPHAEPIGRRFCSEFRPFFSTEVLANTRVAHASGPNPRFYFLVRLLGIRGVLEMSAIGAITLVDVVAYPERMNRSTLFHELVHVVQYRVLGLQQFARLYVTGSLMAEATKTFHSNGKLTNLKNDLAGIRDRCSQSRWTCLSASAREGPEKGDRTRTKASTRTAISGSRLP